MFQTREKKIVELLFTKNNTMTTSEIAAKLNVSTRTIKSDIKRLNTDETFLMNGCSIMTKAGVGYWLVYDEAGSKFLKNMFDDSEELVSPEIRKYMVAWYILKSVDFVPMEEIANEIFISKSTVLLIVNELAPLFGKYDLQLNKKAKYGVRAEGKEGNIRRAMVFVLQKIIGKPNKDVTGKLKEFFEDLDLTAMQLIIRNIEAKRHVMFADISYYEVLFHLIVTVDRVQRGKCCTKEDIIEDYIIAGHDLEEVTYISENVAQELSVRLLSYDLIYLQYTIDSAKTQISGVEEMSPLKQYETKNKAFFDSIVEILKEVGNKNDIDFFEDEEVLAAIVLHLEGVKRRTKNKGHLDNPFLETIKNSMVYEYEVAIEIVDLFSEKYHINADDHEIGFVALHVGAVLEREITKKLRRKQSVYLVCVSGIGLAQYVSAKIARLFPNVEIKQIIPLNRLPLYEHQMEDSIIISTVNVEIEGADVVLISPVLDEEDIKKIQTALERKSDCSSVGSQEFPTIKSLLHKDIAILQCDCKSKEEVIQLLGTRLVNEGYGDKEYIQSVIAREEVSDTSIGNLFAIPHAIGNHVLKNGVGLMTLKKPISWGLEKVQVIFMISINAQTGVNLQKAFAEVMELINNPRIVGTMIKAQKFNEIVASLENNQEAKNEPRGKSR